MSGLLLLTRTLRSLASKLTICLLIALYRKRAREKRLKMHMGRGPFFKRRD